MADSKELTIDELKAKLASTEEKLEAAKAATKKALAQDHVVPKGFKRVDFSDGSYTYVSPKKITVFDKDDEEVKTSMVDIFRGKIGKPNRMGRKVVSVEP